MSWFWTIIFLSFAFGYNYNLSEAKHQKKLGSAAVVVGTVYCDTCFQQDFHKASHFISGASVEVECKNTSSRPGFRQEVKTDKKGEFKVHLPLSISKHVRKIRGCSVRLIRSNQPFCAVAATATSSSLHLKSRNQNTHIFSAGFFTFKPLNQPQLCDQKPITKDSKNVMNHPDKLSPISNPNDPTFLPPIRDPPSDPPALGGFLTPLPQLPPILPPLPEIPFLPPVPKKENATKPSELLSKKVTQPMTFPFPPNPLNPPSIFPPLPFQPPPSLLPPLVPNPFQPPPSIIPPIFPTPPPSLFPPLFPSPSPSPPFFNFPPIPGLTPSPPPPPPPTFPIPLPPLPFPPIPGIPGGPPAEVSSQSKPSSP